MPKKYIKSFRNALKVLLLPKLNYRIDNGEFDDIIKKFLDGDTLQINLGISLLPNDILVMRYLAEGNIDKKVLKKVINLWKKENTKEK